ncbi:uncharacterized protein FOMMEDRAFT_31958 [Fomitiporia mediterranea MF3/22]|uniref:uncharacterized protein n=1 Tax=Fomitiporia mediterranea (strain MF3/22) TaxID=694068 RepID=UPI0004409250|nr:uncharacterized protein FOMMEDRAFT_31958 [Fomitiporia mediterranea MF3/22]EJC98186.1 hypothetical protein FOMMEDRAFT_31958 [Fomitiporia mediterranea MF3/22]
MNDSAVACRSLVFYKAFLLLSFISQNPVTLSGLQTIANGEKPDPFILRGNFDHLKRNLNYFQTPEMLSIVKSCAGRVPCKRCAGKKVKCVPVNNLEGIFLYSTRQNVLNENARNAGLYSFNNGHLLHNINQNHDFPAFQNTPRLNNLNQELESKEHPSLGGLMHQCYPMSLKRHLDHLLKATIPAILDIEQKEKRRLEDTFG